MLLRRRAHEDGDEKASATSSTTPEKRRTTPSRPASPGSASKELRPLKWWSDPAPPSSTTSSSSSQQRALLLLLLLSLGTLVAIGFSASGRRGTASSFDGTTVMNRSALVLERGTLDSNTKTASILSRRTNAHASRPPNNNNKAVKLDIIFRRRGDGRKPNVGAPPPRGGGATRMILPHLLSPHQQQKKKKKKKKNQTSSSATVEGTADYGDLEFNWDDNYDHHKIRRRTIAPNDANRWHKERKAQVRAMNEYHVSETYTPDDELPHEECERVAWKSAPKPLCNAFHEIVLNPGGHRYLG